MCEDSASFDLTSSDISLCLSDVDTILKAKKEELELSVGIYSFYCRYCCGIWSYIIDHLPTNIFKHFSNTLICSVFNA